MPKASYSRRIEFIASNEEDFHATTFRREFDSVGEKIPDHLLQSRAVAPYWTSIKVNTDKAGRLRYSVDIFRSISSKEEGEETPTWRNVHSFSEDDLKLMPVLVAKVQTYQETVVLTWPGRRSFRWPHFD